MDNLYELREFSYKGIAVEIQKGLFGYWAEFLLFSKKYVSGDITFYKTPDDCKKAVVPMIDSLLAGNA